MYSVRDHTVHEWFAKQWQINAPSPTIQNSALNKCKSLNIAGINLLTLGAVEVH